VGAGARAPRGARAEVPARRRPGDADGTSHVRAGTEKQGR
jgi:hypothetical protein